VFKISVRTSQRNYCLSVKNNNHLTLCSDITAVNKEWHTKRTNKLRGKTAKFLNVTEDGIQGVPGGTDLTSGECSLGQTIPI
jgi:hypothetical protein